MQRAISLRPDYPESYNLLAFVNLVSGTGKEVDEAIELMKRVLTASPGRTDSAFMLAQLYLRKRDYKTARPLLDELSKSNSDEEVRQSAQQMLAELDSYQRQIAADRSSAQGCRGLTGDGLIHI